LRAHLSPTGRFMRRVERAASDGTNEAGEIGSAPAPDVAGALIEHLRFDGSTDGPSIRDRPALLQEFGYAGQRDA